MSFNMASAIKNGMTKNVTLPLPDIREVPNQIVKVKFNSFKEIKKELVNFKY
jgi:hypothetical protein